MLMKKENKSTNAIIFKHMVTHFFIFDVVSCMSHLRYRIFIFFFMNHVAAQLESRFLYIDTKPITQYDLTTQNKFVL